MGRRERKKGVEGGQAQKEAEGGDECERVADTVREREGGVCEGVCVVLLSVNEWKASLLSSQR